MPVMKYAFFTGATGGLGGLIIKAMSDTGHWTIFAAGTNEAVLDALARTENVIPLKMDITCQQDIDEALQAVRAHTDSLQAIINFAGINLFTSMVEGDCADLIEKLLAVNVLGMVRVNRTFFEMVYKGRGRIINCSSESGWLTPQPFAGPYFLSKYAVEAYNDSLRRELMFLGIPVIKIQPGFFQTRMSETVFSGFDKTVAESKYYGKLLLRMKPIMMHEMTRNNNPARLVRVVLKAADLKHPKIKYKVGTGPLLALLELLPDSLLDWIYKLLFMSKERRH